MIKIIYTRKILFVPGKNCFGVALIVRAAFFFRLLFEKNCFLSSNLQFNYKMFFHLC